MTYQRAKSLSFGASTGLCSLGLFFLFFCSAACAELKLDLHRVNNLELREAIEDSFNFPTAGPVKADRIGDTSAEARRLTQLMRDFGYVTARTEVVSEADRQAVLMPIPADIYRLGYVALAGISGAEAGPLHAKLYFVVDHYTGKTASSTTMASLRRDILQAIREAGYATPAIRRMAMRINSETGLVGLAISVRPGVRARFGELILQGDHEIHSRSLTVGLTGATYSPGIVEKLRTQLQDAGLFRRISLSLVPRPGNPSIVDIVAQLRRRNRTEAELANNGQLGFGFIASCCALVAVRQIVLSTIPFKARHLVLALDVTAGLASIAVAYFVFERISYLVG